MDIQRTATQARTETRTKAIAAMGLTLLAGLGAYGFGFLPGFENDKLKQERTACYDVCLSNQNLCKEKSKDGALCEPSFQQCNSDCSMIGREQEVQEKQQMVYQDVLNKPETEQVAPQDLDQNQKSPQPDTGSEQSPNTPPQKMLPSVYPTDCIGQCDYDLAKCLTYQTDAVCRPMHEACQMRCAPPSLPPTPPDVSYATTTLTIRPDTQPLSRILVPSEGVWQNVAQYRASSAAEEITLNAIGVEGSTQGSLVIRDVAIAQSGRVLGQAVLPVGRDTRTRVDLSASPLRVPAGGSTVFQIWVRLNEVRHHSITGEVASTTMSAPSVQLGLALNFSDYQYDVDAHASSPRVSVYAPWVRGDDTWGNVFAVRNTRPYVTPLALASDTFTSGSTLDLYRFHLASDAAGPVAIKKMTFNLRAALASGSSLRVSRFHLRRGSADVPASEVRILDEDGRDLLGPATTTLDLSRDRQVIVLFNQQQLVNAAGLNFSLQARTEGVFTTGDALRISFAREPRFHSMINGYLSSEDVMLYTSGGSLLRGPHLDLDNPPRDRSFSTAPFIWSDLLSPTHNARAGMSGGSDDWTVDHQIDDLDSVQVLHVGTPRT